MKKIFFIMIFLSAISLLLILPNKVSALTYTAPSNTNYTATRIGNEWKFNICNISTNACNILDLSIYEDNWIYGTSSASTAMKGVKDVVISYMPNNPSKLDVVIVFKYKNRSNVYFLDNFLIENYFTIPLNNDSYGSRSLFHQMNTASGVGSFDYFIRYNINSPQDGYTNIKSYFTGIIAFENNVNKRAILYSSVNIYNGDIVNNDIFYQSDAIVSGSFNNSTHNFSVIKNPDDMSYSICDSSLCKNLDLSFIDTEYNRYSNQNFRVKDIDSVLMTSSSSNNSSIIDFYLSFNRLRKDINPSTIYYKSNYYSSSNFYFNSGNGSPLLLKQNFIPLSGNWSSDEYDNIYHFTYDFNTNSYDFVDSSSVISITGDNTVLYSNKNLEKRDSNNNVVDSNFHESNLIPISSYLDGYKEVYLGDETSFVYISGITSGRIYIPYSTYLEQQYNLRFAYKDLDISQMPANATITNIKHTDDYQFYYYDFDISNYDGADLVMFIKNYELGNRGDNYSIWIPNNAYSFNTDSVPNDIGGNDFNFEWQDENGDIHEHTDSTSSNLEVNTFFGNLSSSFRSFKTSLSYICSLFTEFFNSLPVFVKSALIVSFSFVIIMAIVSLIL